jgi:hypothetical protein
MFLLDFRKMLMSGKIGLPAPVPVHLLVVAILPPLHLGPNALALMRVR